MTAPAHPAGPLRLAVVDDQAILVAHPLPTDVTMVAELPYDFQRKRMSVLVVGGDAGPLIVTKGALDSVLAVCATAETSLGTVPIETVAAALHERFAALSNDGFRVLGLATKPGGTSLRATDEAGMTLVGLLTFADPVKADAASGPIKPGDLLTTSAIPGHAMKVQDHSKAQGAILGKAMSKLESGTGLVLVLVTLQ